jgi:DNA-binding NarL/FixJ family response regulator
VEIAGQLIQKLLWEMQGGEMSGSDDQPRPQRTGDHPGRKQETLILLVDERAWTREALARALEAACRELRVLRFGDASELAEAVQQAGSAVVLLNLSGIGLDDDRVTAAVASVRASLPGVPVVAIADSTDAEEILGAVERGLSGYIPNSLELRLVIEALRYVTAGGTFVPAEPVLASLEAAYPSLPQNSPAIEAAAPVAANDETAAAASVLDTLTPREGAVLEGVRHGRSNKQIARDLNLREPTVKVHIRHIMRKLGAGNRTQIAIIAERLKSGLFICIAYGAS